MLTIGHRGACGYEPENTLRSFARALTMGVPWIELDVYECEGRLVVIHDASLERTTDGTGRLADRSLSYIRSLDAGFGERVPLLEEVFDLVDRRAGINVELKGPSTAAPTAALINRYVQKQGWTLDQFLVSSFRHELLHDVKRLNPVLPIAVLFDRVYPSMVAYTVSLEAVALNVSTASVDSGLVDEAHEQGLKVFVYTVNTLADIRRMLDLGVDGVFSDYPDRVLALVGSFPSSPKP